MESELAVLFPVANCGLFCGFLSCAEMKRNGAHVCTLNICVLITLCDLYFCLFNPTSWSQVGTYVNPKEKRG